MKQVLIVDDEERLIKSIELGLRSYDDQFEVVTALNGKEAVEALASRDVDLVITDLRMPEMDGFELLAHISSTYPFLPSIVMTAFATPEIEERVNATGIYRLLEKPIDFERLAEAIAEGLAQESKEGSVAGFSLENFLQLLAMEKKTCLLNIKEGDIEGRDIEGHLYLEKGEIKAAVCGNIKGVDALFKLLACENVQITFKKLPKKKVPKMIDKPLMHLLMEGMRRIDEKKAEREAALQNEQMEKDEILAATPEKSVMSDTDNQEEVKGRNTDSEISTFIKGDGKMSKLEEILDKLSDVDGFMAAGVFTPNGEIAAQVNKANVKIAEIGSIANDVLLKAQKATDVMDVGRGNVVHVEAPKAHVIARCLNENTDFSQTESGKVHVHMVLMMDRDANLAMGKMKLEAIIGEVAVAFR